MLFQWVDFQAIQAFIFFYSEGKTLVLRPGLLNVFQ